MGSWLSLPPSRPPPPLRGLSTPLPAHPPAQQCLPNPGGRLGAPPLSPARLLSGGHRRGAPCPGVGFGTPQSPAGAPCLGLRCPKSLHFPGPVGAPCPRTGVPTSHRAHFPCQRRCLGTLCSRCPRGHKAVSEPLMNSALMRGVQLKYQTPPPHPPPPRGVRTVLGRGHDSGWGSRVAAVPSQPGTAVALVGGVTSLSLHPLDKGWGAQRGGGWHSLRSNSG